MKTLEKHPFKNLIKLNPCQDIYNSVKLGLWSGHSCQTAQLNAEPPLQLSSTAWSRTHSKPADWAVEEQHADWAVEEQQHISDIIPVLSRPVSMFK